MSTNPLFCCPIHLGVMTNPITTACGHTFDKDSMESHLAAGPFVIEGWGYQERDVRKSLCPTCRASIPHDWVPVINYDLKAIIEQAVTQAYPLSVGVAPVVQERKTLPIAVTAGRFLTSITGSAQQVHVRLTVADDPAGCIPLDVYKILDISGSMAGRATAPKVLQPGDHEEVTTLLSRNDCSTHATRALVGALKETDRLAILGFDTIVTTYMPLTQMNARGKINANAKIDTIQPRGGTSFWTGIKTALTQLKENYNPANNSVIIFNTDGESDPSYNPTGTTIPDAIAAWKEANPTIKFTLHTVGYGYGASLQMDLLREIAEVGGGSVIYVPDGDMLAQNMIHLFANLSTCTHTNVMVKAGTSQSLVRFLQNQYDLILKMPSTVDTVTVTAGSQVITATIDDETPEEAADAQARDYFVQKLTTSIQTKSMDVSAVAAHLQSFGNTAFIRCIVSDLTHPDKYKGQIGKAFVPANFMRWGDYYLGGVLSGHRNQWRVNFKDEGGKTYGSSTTLRAIDRGVEVYDNLPPIRPSFTPAAGGAAPATVAPTSQGGGICFTGSTLVLMQDGSTKRMDQLHKGDYLHHGFQVRCMIRTRVTLEQQIVRFGVAGITEFHPILHNGIWTHPRDVGPVENVAIPFVYNLILESGHMISLPLAEGSTEVTVACTMAHDFEGPVISHPYFGKRVAGLRNCVDDFQMYAGWSDGYICLKNMNEFRDSTNEIVKLLAEDDTF